MNQTNQIPWTQFWDMHSGGGTKQPPYEKIYIQAPEDEARVIFYNRFGHNPERVTCTCCGEDYSISEYKSLEAATAYHRGCRWSDNDEGYVEEPDPQAFSFNPFTTLEDYCKKPDVLVIRADEIKPEERVGSVPEQGYVWIG